MWFARFGALGATLVLGLAGSCHKKSVVAESGLSLLDKALDPAAMAQSFRQLGGAHFHATSMFRVDTLRGPNDGSKPASPSAVTTTTDLWIDRHGNFRLVESNDLDGGREIVRLGNEVAVALRYGKMTRRPTQESESARFLTEALGAPWAAWEVMRRQVEVEGGGAIPYRLRLGSRLVDLPSGFPQSEGLRRWRETLDVKSLAGEVSLSPEAHAVRAFACKLAFAAARDGFPVEGTIEVNAKLDEEGKVADITWPATSSLHPRQRTVLEERALLGGLGAALSSPAKKVEP